MLRYVAVIAETSAQQHDEFLQRLSRHLQRQSIDWKIAIDQPRVRVQYIASRSHSSDVRPLANNSGIILGPLFRRQDECDRNLPVVATLDARDSERIVQTAGRDLVESYWGSYVAFLRHPNMCVLVAPMGTLRCFHMRAHGVHLLFSDIEDLYAFEPLQFTPDWRTIAGLALLNVYPANATALNEVSAVSPGECLHLSGQHAWRRLYWNPVAIAGRDPIEHVEHATLATAATVRSCVYAWASKYQRIVHRIGGLDSSVVLACLSDCPTKPLITCVTEFSEGSNEDERHFSRLATKAAGCELAEFHREVNFDFDELFQMRKTCVPFDHALDVGAYKRIKGLMRHTEAQALFSGHMGDNLFYLAPAQPAPTDYVRLHGPSPQLLGITFHAARLCGFSVWRLLASAMRDGLFGTRSAERIYWNALRQQAQNTNKAAAADAIESVMSDNRLVHPWIVGASDVPPGKAQQILGLSQYLVENPIRLSDDWDEVHPFIAQPLAELSLRIPIYVQLHRGWDRAICRRAFRGSVPQEILARTTKGGREEHAKQVVRSQMPHIRELIMDGELASRRLIDRSRLEPALSGQPNTASVSLGEILAYVAIEIWVQSWISAPSRAASFSISRLTGVAQANYRTT